MCEREFPNEAAPTHTDLMVLPETIDEFLEKHPLPSETVVPISSEDRKATPIATGLLDYFPDAIVELARLSHDSNEQHNPGEPVHWERGKSDDHDDCAMRHFMDRGKRDTDGKRHTAKAAWRLLAMLQLEIENDR